MEQVLSDEEPSPEYRLDGILQDSKRENVHEPTAVQTAFSAVPRAAHVLAAFTASVNAVVTAAQ